MYCGMEEHTACQCPCGSGPPVAADGGAPGWRTYDGNMYFSYYHLNIERIYPGHPDGMQVYDPAGSPVWIYDWDLDRALDAGFTGGPHPPAGVYDPYPPAFAIGDYIQEAAHDDYIFGWG